MSEEERIRRTIALYAQRHDDRDAEGYVELFARDGRLITGAIEYVGRTAIREFISSHYANQDSARRTKHLLGASVIDVNGDTAQATTDTVVYQRQGDRPWEVLVVGRYRDRLMLEEGEWRFAERRTPSTPDP